MTEENLYELYDLIAGRGKWAWSGSAGFFTHPGYGEREDKIHVACLELEKRGLIEKTRETGHTTAWAAK